MTHGYFHQNLSSLLHLFLAVEKKKSKFNMKAIILFSPMMMIFVPVGCLYGHFLQSLLKSTKLGLYRISFHFNLYGTGGSCDL